MTDSPALLLSTADTELLAARAAGGWRTANPATTSPAALPGLVEGCPVVVVRLLGGQAAWREGLDALLAAARVPVVLDGVIAGSAALVAAALCPLALQHALAGHVSAEPGHALALRALGLRPLLGLDLRLGEGTGALLAVPLVASAARALRDVATFDSAGVTQKSG